MWSVRAAAVGLLTRRSGYFSPMEPQKGYLARDRDVPGELGRMFVPWLQLPMTALCSRRELARGSRAAVLGLFRLEGPLVRLQAPPRNLCEWSGTLFKKLTA